MRIELNGLECYGYHGVFAEEKRTGQPFIVDIVCQLPDAVDDDLATTVNYAELADVAANIVEGPARDLIETVAAEIATAARVAFPLLESIEVTVHKPQAPIPRTFADVSVTARR
ncbi:dihydroneopterin aldolase [Corynebacterium lizhenjunii]|uniref:7,8-dihydroneopterin aldolase n=1 Tax=Corynebacterium lizhenjunii TaxID=2709394 RepID=A0A7T0PAV6_9CORY|nr:dihydroneopterin aldolase [Corynebacterium lizhenjunii]QPK79501.1 dihydroneopterin aldolase [Corynebacterium lizhenjunii]